MRIGKICVLCKKQKALKHYITCSDCHVWYHFGDFIVETLFKWDLNSLTDTVKWWWKIKR